MNLRFIERDGKKILQFKDIGFIQWYDVPFVEEPRKPREYLVEAFDNRNGPYRAWESGQNEAHLLHYTGEKPNMACMVKVREVLE